MENTNLANMMYASFHNRFVFFLLLFFRMYFFSNKQIMNYDKNKNNNEKGVTGNRARVGAARAVSVANVGNVQRFAGWLAQICDENPRMRGKFEIQKGSAGIMPKPYSNDLVPSLEIGLAVYSA